MQFLKHGQHAENFSILHEEILYGILKFKLKITKLPRICNGNSPNWNRSGVTCSFLPLRCLSRSTQNEWSRCTNRRLVRSIVWRNDRSPGNIPSPPITFHNPVNVSRNNHTSNILGSPPPPTPHHQDICSFDPSGTHLTKHRNYNYHPVSTDLLFSDPQFDNWFLNTYTAKQFQENTYSTTYSSLT